MLLLFGLVPFGVEPQKLITEDFTIWNPCKKFSKTDIDRILEHSLYVDKTEVFIKTDPDKIINRIKKYDKTFYENTTSNVLSAMKSSGFQPNQETSKIMNSPYDGALEQSQGPDSIQRKMEMDQNREGASVTQAELVQRRPVPSKFIIKKVKSEDKGLKEKPSKNKTGLPLASSGFIPNYQMGTGNQKEKKKPKRNLKNSKKTTVTHANIRDKTIFIAVSQEPRFFWEKGKEWENIHEKRDIGPEQLFQKTGWRK